ncbi:MAG: hypothetical protein AAB311_03660, partial [Nitrospirota bacterium]
MRGRLTFMVVGCLVVYAGAAGFALAAGDPISEKIERERKTLEQLKDKIEEKRKRADEAEKKRESVLQGIQTLDERLVRTRQEHQEINKKLRKKDREIDSITEQLGAIRGSIQERRDAILARLRVQYMEGRAGYVKTLLSADSYGDFQRRLQYLSAVSQKDFELMGTFRADVGRMEQAERQRAEARAGMLAYKDATEKKLSDIRSLQKEKKVYFTKITQEKESFSRAAEELERSASRVDSLLHELETRRKAMAMRPSTAPAVPRG